LLLSLCYLTATKIQPFIPVVAQSENVEQPKSKMVDLIRMVFSSSIWMDATSHTYVELKGPHTYMGIASWSRNYCSTSSTTL